MQKRLEQAGSDVPMSPRPITPSVFTSGTLDAHPRTAVVATADRVEADTRPHRDTPAAIVRAVGSMINVVSKNAGREEVVDSGC